MLYYKKEKGDELKSIETEIFNILLTFIHRDSEMITPIVVKDLIEKLNSVQIKINEIKSEVELKRVSISGSKTDIIH